MPFSRPGSAEALEERGRIDPVHGVERRQLLDEAAPLRRRGACPPSRGRRCCSTTSSRSGIAKSTSKSASPTRGGGRPLFAAERTELGVHDLPSRNQTQPRRGPFRT